MQNLQNYLKARNGSSLIIMTFFKSSINASLKKVTSVRTTLKIPSYRKATTNKQYFIYFLVYVVLSIVNDKNNFQKQFWILWPKKKKQTTFKIQRNKHWKDSCLCLFEDQFREMNMKRVKKNSELVEEVRFLDIFQRFSWR